MAFSEGANQTPKRALLNCGYSVAPIYCTMLEVDDSDFTQDHIDFLQEWADNLGVSVAVLLGRIILARSECDQYVAKAPKRRPTPDEDNSQ